jgi:diguanylate cyclase (GGDEF)-like protein
MSEQFEIANRHTDIRQRVALEKDALRARIANKEPQEALESIIEQYARDRVASQEKEKRLRKYAKKDDLTGFLNRTGFREVYDDAVERARRTNGQMAFVFMDINGFSHINESIGHEKADELLKIIGKTITKAIRKTDAASRLNEENPTNHAGARLGGDEFGLLITDTGIEGALKVWDRVKNLLATEPSLLSSNVTMSAGVSLVNLDDIEQSRIDADFAMYDAKKRNHDPISPDYGKNVIEIHQDKPQDLK